MVRFETMWPPRTFRKNAGYMLTVNKDLHVFMMEIRTHDRTLSRLNFYVLLGTGYRVDDTLVYTVEPDANQKRTEEQIRQHASQWAIREPLEHLREKESYYKNLVDDTKTVMAQYEKYPGHDE